MFNSLTTTKMSTRYLITTILLALVGLTGCQKEDSLHATLDKPKYDLQPGDNTTDQFIYQFYQDNGSYILYDYDSLDYCWNLTRIMDLEFVKQPNKELVLKGIQTMKKIWIDLYPTEFVQRYFPYKIMLADTIWDSSSSILPRHETFCFSAINYVAFGRVHEGVDALSSDSLKTLSGIINGIFWGQYLCKYNRVFIPQQFYQVSGEEYYNENLQNYRTNEEVENNVKLDPRNYGFLEEIYDGLDETVNTPTYEEDVEQFVRCITSHTEEEMLAIVTGFPKLEDKYYILKAFILDTYGVDIQTIGNTVIN